MDVDEIVRHPFGPKLDAHCPFDETTLRLDLEQDGKMAICPVCWTNFHLPQGTRLLEQDHG